MNFLKVGTNIGSIVEKFILLIYDYNTILLEYKKETGGLCLLLLFLLIV